MELTDVVEKAELEKIVGKPFGIAEVKGSDGKYTFHPEIDYERKEFVNKAGDLFDLSEYQAKLRQNSGDVDALNDTLDMVMGYMEGNNQYKAQWMEKAKENPHLALGRADEYLSVGQENMARYVEKHRDEFLNKLSDKALLALIQDPQLPLYKTGDKKHDLIVNLKERVNQIQEALKEGKDVTSIVAEELKQLISYMPKENANSVEREQQIAYPGLAGIIIEAMYKKYNSAFRGKNGKLYKKELIRYLKASYKVAEDFTDDIKGTSKSEQKEKADYWKKNLKVHYLAIAQMLYAQEKSEQKKEDNPDKEARKKKAGELRMTA